MSLLLRTWSGWQVMRMLDAEDFAMLLLATNARFRIGVRFTTNNQTGYEMRPECILFGRNAIPEPVQLVLKENGLPVQNQFTDTVHLQKMLRITKAWRDFTKEPDGWLLVARFNGRVPELKFHEDVERALEVFGDDADAL